MSDITPTSILGTLVEDLVYFVNELDGGQGYAKHPDDGNAVTVETYTDDGEVEARYTVTFNIEKQEN